LQAAAPEESAAGDEKGTDARSRDLGKGKIDLAVRAGVQYSDL
jgi:hypothetical protein